jgi:hypothetical protein
LQIKLLIQNGNSGGTETLTRRKPAAVASAGAYRNLSIIVLAGALVIAMASDGDGEAAITPIEATTQVAQNQNASQPAKPRRPATASTGFAPETHESAPEPAAPAAGVTDDIPRNALPAAGTGQPAQSAGPTAAQVERLIAQSEARSGARGD